MMMTILIQTMKAEKTTMKSFINSSNTKMKEKTKAKKQTQQKMKTISRRRRKQKSQESNMLKKHEMKVLSQQDGTSGSTCGQTVKKNKLKTPKSFLPTGLKMCMIQTLLQFVTVKMETCYLRGLKMGHWWVGTLRLDRRNLSFMKMIQRVESRLKIYRHCRLIV